MRHDGRIPSAVLNEIEELLGRGAVEARPEAQPITARLDRPQGVAESGDPS